MIFNRSAALLKSARELKGKSQSELANLAGVHTQFVSNWERALCMPPKNKLKKLVGLLSIDPKNLIKAIDEDNSEHVRAEYSALLITKEKSKK